MQKAQRRRFKNSRIDLKANQPAATTDTVDNVSNNKSSILIGNYLNTGGFSNSVLIGSGEGLQYVANTKENQFKIAPSLSDINIEGLILSDFADDTAATTGVVSLGGLYHTAGVVKIRLT